MSRARLPTAILALAAFSAADADAQSTYPDRPIRLVIGSAPGSGPDIISRTLSERLWRSWNQRIVVDSRPGAAGLISAELVNHAAADGYTWMMLTSQLLVATQVLPNVRINLEKDFASIALVGSVPFVLTINPQVPAKSVSDLIALAKKSPGELRYGSAGTGATEHLTAVMFTHMTGTSMLHVPYKGVAQALGDTIAREVHLTFAVLPAALPLVQSGRLRALAVTTPKRSAALPEVPTVAATIPGFENYGWYSIVAPTGTPVAILEKVSAEVVKAVKEPEFAEQLKGLGIDIIGGTRQELDTFRREQTRRLADLIKNANVKLAK